MQKTELNKANISQNLKGFNALDDIFKDMVSPPKKEEKVSHSVNEKFSPSPDLNSITVPDSLIESITNFAVNKGQVKQKIEKVIEEKEEIEEEVQEEILNEDIAANKLNDLVARLSALLKEAKDLMVEMTTVGMIGTNQKFVLGKKKKNGLTKTIKRN